MTGSASASPCHPSDERPLVSVREKVARLRASRVSPSAECCSGLNKSETSGRGCELASLLDGCWGRVTFAIVASVLREEVEGDDDNEE